ncbi:hypothetical protein LMH87_009713 [Akanthomyces muscarius]|uniref:Uncharacterized protein n=1 Tax=Akanthomyces muscarius TaxID=2231603 RepID=A0A9W8QEH3_AKAMU|nr:hypothetical protein LMH87_009713 [Akanthomyces muscarius]KAJ4153216.1 hypothetical protein LMH87_009713 [Akanthomyces muscarius]
MLASGLLAVVALFQGVTASPAPEAELDMAAPRYVCPKCPASAPLCALNLNTRQPKCCPEGKPLANNAGCYTSDNVICNNTQIWAPGTHCPCV